MAEDRLDENTTILEYYNRRAEQMKEDWGFPGMPHDVAVAIRDTALMIGPSNGKSIKNIAIGEQVNLFILADYTEDLMREYKEGDWIKVNSEGDVGWVNGNDFRVMAGDEADTQVLNGLKTAFRFVFPDSTLWGIIKTFLIGLGITVLARIIGRFLELIDRIHTMFPIAFFIINGWEGRTLAFIEVGIIFWAVIFIIAIIEYLTYLVTHKLFGWD